MQNPRSFATWILDETNTRKDVYVDRGYAKHARESDLYVRGYRARIQRQGSARKPISEAQRRRNRCITKQRAFGEHPFARLAQMGGKHLRTIGLARANVVIGLKVIAHNVVHRSASGAAETQESRARMMLEGRRMAAKAPQRRHAQCRIDGQQWRLVPWRSCIHRRQAQEVVIRDSPYGRWSL